MSEQKEKKKPVVDIEAANIGDITINDFGSEIPSIGRVEVQHWKSKDGKDLPKKVRLSQKTYRGYNNFEFLATTKNIDYMIKAMQELRQKVAGLEK